VDPIGTATRFGEDTEGLDVVKTIKTKVDFSDNPVEFVINKR
jgi:hypothetical protein